MNKIKLAFWILGLCILFVETRADAKGNLDLVNEVFQEVIVVNEKGKPEIKQVPVTTSAPGSEMIYKITYRNMGDKPLENVVIHNPLAADLIYKDQSAQGDGTTILVSVDGGKKYGDIGELTIPTQDGESRPAKASDVTHLQFNLSKKIQPAESGTVTFRAILK
ncbi:MAG: hypothetical protein AAB035_01460 [Nitrospirota bacterium]